MYYQGLNPLLQLSIGFARFEPQMDFLLKKGGLSTLADGGGAVELVNLVSWAPWTPFQIQLEVVLRVRNLPWYLSFAVFLLWECCSSVGGGEGLEGKFCLENDIMFFTALSFNGCFHCCNLSVYFNQYNRAILSGGKTS